MYIDIQNIFLFLFFLEYIPARFGQMGSLSYAVFPVNNKLDLVNLTLSMFLHTHQKSGLLLAVTNRTSQYLNVWLEQGRLTTQIHSSQTVACENVVSDGHLHLVGISIAEGQIRLLESDLVCASVEARQIYIRTGDKIYVGGMEDADISARFGGYFKGCIQDLRLNNWRLQFFPFSLPVIFYSPERLVNVLEGCVGDELCAVGLKVIHHKSFFVTLVMCGSFLAISPSKLCYNLAI